MNRPILIPFLLIVVLLLLSGKILCAATHKAKRGYNLNSIAKKYRQSTKKLKQRNDPKPRQIKIARKYRNGPRKNGVSKEAEIAVSETDGEFVEYRTEKGDTLDKIARRFKVDIDDIMEANELTDKRFADNRLSPDKTILIPKVAEEQNDGFASLPNKPLKPWKNPDEKYMLVKVAKGFMGAPYKYGGESVRGLDAAAFVKKVYDTLMFNYRGAPGNSSGLVQGSTGRAFR